MLLNRSHRLIICAASWLHEPQTESPSFMEFDMPERLQENEHTRGMVSMKKSRFYSLISGWRQMISNTMFIQWAYFGKFQVQLYMR